MRLKELIWTTDIVFNHKQFNEDLRTVSVLGTTWAALLAEYSVTTPAGEMEADWHLSENS